MNCEEFRANRLAGVKSDQDQHHLDECTECRAHLEMLDTSRNVLDDPAVWEEPSPELRTRVGSLIGSLPETGRPQRRRSLFGLVAVAAVAVVMVGLAVFLRPPSPDWEITIPGTESAPTAQGTISGWNEESGTRLHMTVDGLDPAPEGYIYEMWLSTDTIHVSAGTFTDPSSVDMVAGVSRADYPRLWVTLEPIDEDESPSGETVLDTYRQ